MTTIEKAAAQLGDNVAEAFAKKVRTVLDEVDTSAWEDIDRVD